MMAPAALSALVLALALAHISPADAVYPWRASLESCWTNTSCRRCAGRRFRRECAPIRSNAPLGARRALAVSHGGDWDLSRPYDSFPAFVKAFEDGTDAVKGDFRVSKDNVGAPARRPLAQHQQQRQ
jgi:hypothetical protein